MSDVEASMQRPAERTSRRGLLHTPDGRYIVVEDRLWRATNPELDAALAASLRSELMAARRAVAAAIRDQDPFALSAARDAVGAAKLALGERGPVWWSDGARDYNRFLAKNTPYAEWYATTAFEVDHDTG